VTPPPAVKPVVPAPVRPEPRPEVAPAAPKTHVIRKGETLERIAMQYYGTREGVQWIVQANRLDNPHKIRANTKLVIPARKELTKDAGAKAEPAAKKTATKVPSRYVVKEGDKDLYAICRRLYGREGQGARVARIMELNHLYHAEVKPGTILILPAK
jgi:nucleoid-associated protein YgaU